MTACALIDVPAPRATISEHAIGGSTFVVIATELPARPRWLASLTTAEATVLALAGKGMHTAEIAAIRRTSGSTVVKQLGAVKAKTGSANRASLVALGRRYFRDGTRNASCPTDLDLHSALRAAVRNLGTRRPLALAEGHALWASILEGRWGFVELRDLMGKRWLLLRERRRPWAGLSDQQQALVAQLLDGASNKALAADLGVSASTISRTLKSTLRRLDIPDRAELVVVATALRGDGPECNN